MLPPTHLATGFMISKIAVPRLVDQTSKNQHQAKKQNYAKKTYGFLHGAIWFFSVIPDIDLLWAWENHRFSLLHFPLFWMAICLVVGIIGLLTRTSSLKLLAITMFLGTISHLTLDSIGFFEGIYWLYPFNPTKFSLFPITVVAPSDLVGLTVTYFSHPLFILEAFICALGIASLGLKSPFLSLQAK